jgi:hypothetical protein
MKRTGRAWGLAWMTGVPVAVCQGSAKKMKNISPAHLLLGSEAGRLSDGSTRDLFTNTALSLSLPR